MRFERLFPIVVVVALAATNPALATTITTVAGNGSMGFSGDGGPATAAGFQRATLLARDGAGNLYIQDVARIRRVDAVTGVITTVAGIGGNAGFSGDGGQATAAAIDVTSFAVDSAGNLYLGTYFHPRIRRVDHATGIITTYAGTGFSDYTCPTGDGGPATAAMLCGPWGLAVDSGGNLLITDLLSGIRRVDAATGIITSLTTSFFAGTHIALDGADNIYLLGRSGHIWRIDAGTSNVTVLAGSGNIQFGGDPARGDGGPALLADLPFVAVIDQQFLAVDAGGNIFLAHPDLNRVRRIDAASGIITTVAGTGTQSFGGDGGPANAATLNTPLAVMADASGGVYIADTGNYRVRHVSLAPPACGDGVTNAGEQCDAGAAPAPCCTAACNVAAAGTACTDYDTCTVNDQCDGTLLCVGGGPLDCDNGDPCALNTCDRLAGCMHGLTPDSLGGGEPGCIPSSREAAACPNRVNRNAAKLATALLKCHTRRATAALKQTAFDEGACEASAQAKYTAANLKLSGCPGCLDAAAVGAAITDFVDTTATAALYCDNSSGLPLGDVAGAGFLPPDRTAAACVAKAAHAYWRLLAVEVGCHVTLATDDVAGASFDVAACESAGEGRYTAAGAKLTGCPACVTTNLPTLASATGVNLDQENVMAYCSP